VLPDRVGCADISAREPWADTSGPTRGLLVSVFGWVAEQVGDAEVRIERLVDTLARIGHSDTVARRLQQEEKQLLDLRAQVARLSPPSRPPRSPG
jgi:hypothetical protein